MKPKTKARADIRNRKKRIRKEKMLKAANQVFSRFYSKMAENVFIEKPMIARIGRLGQTHLQFQCQPRLVKIWYDEYKADILNCLTNNYMHNK